MKTVFLCILLLAPTEAVQAAGGRSVKPETELTFSGAAAVEDNNTKVTTKDSVNLYFNISFSSGTSGNGTYWYTGLKTGSGTYQNGTTLNLQPPNTQTGYINVSYRANGTGGMEDNRTVSILFDQSKPTLSISPFANAVDSGESSGYDFRAASNGSISITCADANSNLSEIRVMNGATEVDSTTTSSLLFGVSGLTAGVVVSRNIECEDIAGNIISRSINITVDDVLPSISHIFSSAVPAHGCVSPTWSVWTSMSDVSGPVSEYVSVDNGTVWNTHQNPYSPTLNFSGDISYRAIDGVGLDNYSNITGITVDSLPPVINASWNSTGKYFTVSVSDQCDPSPSLLARWESSNGSYSSWFIPSNQSFSIPSPFNLTSSRLHIHSVDLASRTSNYSSIWVAATSSISESISYILNSTSIAGYSNDSMSMWVGLPTGFSAELDININGSLDSTIYFNQTKSEGINLSHSQSVELILNWTNGSVIGSHSWNYSIDSEVGTTPTIGVSGDSVIKDGKLFVDASASLLITNVDDDPGGVGDSHCECRDNASSDWTALSSSTFSLQGVSGQEVWFNVSCRIVDLLGNVGEIIWKNGTIDAIAPEVSVSPSGNPTIAPSSTISVSLTDSQGAGSSRLVWEWSNETSTILGYKNFSGSSWSGSVNTIFSNSLSDGNLTLIVYANDVLGNENISSGHSFTLNTSQTGSTLSVSGTRVNNYLLSSGATMYINPPSGSGTTSTLNWSMVMNNGSVVYNGSSSSTVTQVLANIIEGAFWVNVSTTDSQGRTIFQSWNFTIDNSVSKKPVLSISGTEFINQNGTRYVSAGSVVSLSSLSDDPEGVGYSFTECKEESDSSWTRATASAFALSPVAGQETEFNISCRIVDLLGNRGDASSINGTIDALAPSVIVEPVGTPKVALNSSIWVNLTDTQDMGTSILRFTWDNGSDISWKNLTFQGSSWNGTPYSLFGSIGDGDISLTVYAYDNLSNLKQSSGHQWVLNTTAAVATISVSGTEVNGYLPASGSTIHINPPSGWHSAVTMVWSMERDDGSVHDNGTAVNSTVSRTLTGLTDGRLWVNVTVTDSFGRSVNQSMQFTIDGNVSSTPIINISGSHFNSSGEIFVSATAYISLSSLSDDPEGVGYSFTECKEESDSSWTRATASAFALSPVAGQETEFNISCRIVDLLGNRGDASSINGTIDALAPSVIVEPVGTPKVALNSSIWVNLTDTQDMGTSILRFTWDNGSDISWKNLTFQGSSWNGTPYSLFGSIGDGDISLTVYAYDNLSNLKQSSGHQWVLNTTAAVATISVSGTEVNGYLPASGSTIHINPPSGWHSAVTMVWSMERDDGSVHDNGTAVNSTVSRTLTGLTDGRLWVNVTVTDSFGRSVNQSMQFTIDGNVSNIPVLTISGATNLSNGTLYVSASAFVRLSNLSDDAIGVGYSYSECKEVADSGWTRVSSTSFALSATHGEETGFKVSCRIVDLLGNIGDPVWINGTIDASAPAVSVSPSGNPKISVNSTIQVQLSGDRGFGTSILRFTWSDGSSTKWQNESFGGSLWEGNATSVFGATLSDGDISLTVLAYDEFGNVRQSSGHQWVLNTTLPLAMLSITGTVWNDYLPSDNVTIHINPPSGSHLAANISWSIVRSSGVVYANGSSNNTVSQSLSNMSDGTLWINVTTTDAFGRMVNQTWNLTIDGSVGTAPTLSIPLTSQETLNGTMFVSAGTSIKVSNLRDDAWGVGYSHVECMELNDASWTSVTTTYFAISGVANEETDFDVSCRIVDELGNRGNTTRINGTIDLLKPEISVSPQGNPKVAADTILNVSLSDDQGLSNSSLRFIWDNGSATAYRNVTFQGAYWNGTVASVFGTLGDGTVSLAIYAYDALNNLNESQGYQWELNTTLPLASISISGDQWNGYLPPNNVTIHLSPPSGSHLGAVLNWSIERSNGSVYGNGSSNVSVSQSLTNMSDGPLWVNVTVRDVYGRTVVQSWQFTIDGSVGVLPVLTVFGETVGGSPNLFVSADAEIRLSNLSDDPWGVGYHSVECRNGSSTWASISSGNFSIFSVSNQETLFSVTCRIIDRFGNRGPIVWKNGTIDALAPNITVSSNGLSTLAEDSIIYVNLTDNQGVGTSRLFWTWSDGSSTVWVNDSFSEASWNGSSTSVFGVKDDGVITLVVKGYDSLNNHRTSSTYQWNLNTTLPQSILSINGSDVNGYLPSNNITIHLTPPSGLHLAAIMNWSIVQHDGTVYANGLNNSTVSQVFTNLTDGSLWINVTTTDAFGRSVYRSWNYTVDGTVGTIPTLFINGDSVMQNGARFVSSSSYISVSNLRDDSSGVGYDFVECKNGSGDYVRLSSSSLSLYSEPNAETNFTITCRIVDLLGNHGIDSVLNGTIDALKPNVSVSYQSGDVISHNSTIGFSCSDTLASSRYHLYWVQSNATNTTQGNLSLAGLNPMLSSLNLLPSGTLNLIYQCRDVLGNIGQYNLSGLYFTSFSPSSEVVLVGDAHGQYHESNTTVRYSLNSNGHVNITVQFTLFSSEHNHTYHDFNVSNNGSIDISNLSSGRYQISAKTCSPLTCTMNNMQVMIDADGPTGTPLFISAGGDVFNGTSLILVGMDTRLRMTSLFDNRSGLSRVDCNWSGNYLSMNLSADVWWQPSMWNVTLNNTTPRINCTAYDNLNNPGVSSTWNFSFDHQAPTISLSVNDDSGYIYPDTTVQYNCTDSGGATVTDLRWTLASTVYAFNDLDDDWSGNISSLVPSSASNGDTLYMMFVCKDRADNRMNSQNLSFVYIEEFISVEISHQNVFNGVTSTILGNSSVIDFSPSVEIGRINVSASWNGTEIWWLDVPTSSHMNLNVTHFEAIFTHSSSPSSVLFTILHYSVETNLTSKTTVGPYTPWFDAPGIDNINRTMLANGSSALVTLDSNPCNWILVDFNIASQNGSLNLSDDTFTFSMPPGIVNNETLHISIRDCLGNDASQNRSIVRDVSPPSYVISGLVSSGTSSSNSLLLNLTDDSGFQYINFSILYQNSTILLCQNLTSCGFTLASKGNFTHGSQGDIIIDALSDSGEKLTANISFYVDDLVEGLHLDRDDSRYMYLDNVTNNSIISFRLSESAAILCVTLDNGSDYHTCNNNSNWINYATLHNLTGYHDIDVKAIDLHGNQAIYSYRYFYSSQWSQSRSSATDLHHNLSSNGYIDLIVDSPHNLPFTVSMKNMSVGNFTSNNSRVYIGSGSGLIIFETVVTDALERSTYVNVTVIIDLSSPQINLSWNGILTLGSETNLTLQVSEDLTVISSYSITISDGNVNCTQLYNLSTFSFNDNFTIGSLIGTPGCSIADESIQSLQISILAINIVGRSTLFTRNLSFVGEMVPPLLDLQFAVQVDDVVYVSIHSIISCNYSQHPLYSSMTVDVESDIGNAIENGGQISNISSHGVIICSGVDSLNNSDDSTFVIVHVHDDLLVEFEYLNNSFGANYSFSNYGKGNVLLNVTANQSVSHVNYSIDGGANVSSFEGEFILSGLSPGTRAIDVWAHSILGYSRNLSFYITIDSDIPQHSIIDHSLIEIDDATIMVQGSLPTTLVEVNAFDPTCNNTDIEVYFNGALGTRAITHWTWVLSSSITAVNVTVVDCVGSFNTTHYSVEKRYDVFVPNVAVFSPTIVYGTTVYIGKDYVEMTVSINDPQMPISLDCNYTTSGATITCDLVPGVMNEWSINVSTNLSSSLTFANFSMKFTDGVNLHRWVNRTVLWDVDAPVCTIEGEQGIGNTWILDDSTVVNVSCTDTMSNIESLVMVPSSGQPIEENGIEAADFDLSTSSVWTFFANDSFGNSYQKNLTIFMDISQPVINCSANGIGFNHSLIVLQNVNINCIISDESSFHTNWTIELEGASSPCNGCIRAFLNNSVININNPNPMVDGTVFNVSIISTDAFGNPNERLFKVLIDRLVPTIVSSSVSGALGSSLDTGIIDHDGSFAIIITDINGINHASVTLECEGSNPLSNVGLSGNNITHQLNMTYVQNCNSEYVNITVSATDVALNTRIINEVLFIDNEIPSIILNAGTCRWSDEEVIHYLTSLCQLSLTTSDDSIARSQLVNIEGWINNVSVGEYEDLMTIPLAEYEGAGVFDVRVSAKDATGKVAVLLFSIIISDTLDVSFSDDTCNSVSNTCDYFNSRLLMTQHGVIGFENIDTQDQTPLDSTFDFRVCEKEHCSSMEWEPWQMGFSALDTADWDGFGSQLSDGIKRIEVLQYDELGRSVRKMFVLELDFHDPVIHIEVDASKGYVSDYEFVRCVENCKIVFSIEEESLEEIRYRFGDDSDWSFLVNESGQNYVISLSEEGDEYNSLTIEVTSTSGRKLVHRINLTVSDTLMVREIVVMNPAGNSCDLGSEYDSGINSDIVCFYRREDTDSSNRINLSIIWPHENDIERTFIIGHVVGDDIDAMVTNNKQEFSLNELSKGGVEFSVSVWEQVGVNSNNAWINHSFSIEDPYGPSIIFKISLFDVNMFSVSGEWSWTEMSIAETGELNFNGQVNISLDISDDSILSLEPEGVLEAQEMSLRDSECSLIGERWNVESNRFDKFTVKWECGFGKFGESPYWQVSRNANSNTISLRIESLKLTDEEGVLILTENWDWDSGRIGLPFFLLKNVDFLIRYTDEYGYSHDMIFREVGNQIDIIRTPSSIPDLSPACTEVIDVIDNSEFNYVEDTLENYGPAYCLSNLLDFDYALQVGLRFSLIPFVGSDPVIINMMCQNGNNLPKELNDWIRRTGEGKLEDCHEMGSENLSKLNLEKRYAAIEVTAISCDIRCMHGDGDIEEVPTGVFLIRDEDNTIRDPEVMIEVVYFFGAGAAGIIIWQFWPVISQWLITAGLLKRKEKD